MKSNRTSENPANRSRGLYAFLPAAVFVAGTLATVAFWHETQKLAHTRMQLAFDLSFQRVLDTVKGRSRANEQVLRGVAGLFDGDTQVTRSKFAAFVAALHLDEHYPGIQGVGFALRIPASQLANHEAAVQAEGFANYRVRPPGLRDPYSSIVFLEPFDWRNQRAFGYDMFAEAVRHTAMEQARVSGHAAMSGKVKLVQETETQVQAGFLLYVPVFEHAPLTTAQAPGDRKLLGWAYSPVRVRDLIEGMFRTDLANQRQWMSLTIHDGERPDSDSLLFASDPTPSADNEVLSAKATILLAGHAWTLSAASRPAFYAAHATGAPVLNLLAGMVISLLLAVLINVLARNNARISRALEATAAANTELDASEKALQISTVELQRHRHHLEDLVAEQTTALKQSNAELLRAKDAAEAANRAKDSFLANMSHEIRTPLNAISGMNYLVRRDGVAPQQADRLGKVDDAVGHLLDIIDDILDISKIEAGKFSLDPAPLDLSKLVHNTSAMLGGQVESRGLTLRVEVGELPVPLLGDAKRLRQCLLNYLNNALKFTSQGSITLRAQCIATTTSDVKVRFEVADTGIGIDAESLGRLFMPFEQADNSTTRRYGGTGLGLVITRRLAELMDGEAGVASELGAGSTFWFTARLPRSRQSIAEDEPTMDEDAELVLSRDHAGTRVLLAEDDLVSRELARELLADVGLQVDTASDGHEAVLSVEQHPYALIFMDMQMPVLGGLDASRAIRRLPHGANAPIVAMTANAFAEDRAACLESGMNDFIAKPIAPKLLYSIVLRWLRAAPGPKLP